MQQIQGQEKASLSENQKEKVSVSTPYIRVGDGTELFFVGFLRNGMTEYLMIPKNGEPELKPGTYHVPNRFHIESFNLLCENGEWLMEARYIPNIPQW